MHLERVTTYSFVENLQLTPLLPLKIELTGNDAAVSQYNYHLSFQAFNTSYEFLLSPKDDLFLHNRALLTVDGQLSKELNAQVVDTIYEGVNAQDEENGWARLVFHGRKSPIGAKLPEFEGAFSVDNEIFHIKSSDMYKKSRRDIDTDLASPLSRPANQQTSNMIVFYDSEQPFHRRSTTSPTTPQQVPNVCGFSIDKHHNWNTFQASETARLFLNSDHSISAAHSPLQRRGAACNGNRQYMLMGAAADCTYVNSYGGPSGALTQILSDFNTASKVYESSFNVSLALIKVNLQSSCTTNGTDNMAWNQPCSDTYTINNRL
ncbi:hypothetical protein HDU76_011882, partial [Blyttiomyces sp. JEL0837]